MYVPSRRKKTPPKNLRALAAVELREKRFNVARPLRGPRVGSQARSKARDSRSLPEGVPRFESWPTHPDSPPYRGLRTYEVIRLMGACEHPCNASFRLRGRMAT